MVPENRGSEVSQAQLYCRVMSSGCTKEHFHERADISKTCFYEGALPNRRVVWLISNSQYTRYVH